MLIEEQGLKTEGRREKKEKVLQKIEKRCGRQNILHARKKRRKGEKAKNCGNRPAK